MGRVDGRRERERLRRETAELFSEVGRLRVGPVRDHRDAARAVRLQVGSEAPGDRDDEVRLTVDEPLEAADGADPGRMLRQRAHRHDRVGPEVAHLEDERDPLQAGQRPAGHGDEELRRRREDEVGTSGRPVVVLLAPADAHETTSIVTAYPGSAVRRLLSPGSMAPLLYRIDIRG